MSYNEHVPEYRCGHENEMSNAAATSTDDTCPAYLFDQLNLRSQEEHREIERIPQEALVQAPRPLN